MATMTRGTTPILQFDSDVDLSDLSVAWLTFRQGNLTVTKELSDLQQIVDGFQVQLTQSETLRFNDKTKCEIQLRGLLKDNSTAIATNIVQITVGEILKDGVIAVGVMV